MKLLSWEHAGFYLRLFSCWSPSWPLLAGAQLELSLIWKIQLLQLQRSRKWRIQMGVRKRRQVESWLHANETFVVFQMNKIKTVLLLKRPKKSANLESIHTLPAAKQQVSQKHHVSSCKIPEETNVMRLSASRLPLSIISQVCLSTMAAEATGRRVGRGQSRLMDQGWTWAIADWRADCIWCWCGHSGWPFDSAHVSIMSNNNHTRPNISNLKQQSWSFMEGAQSKF